MRHPSVAILAAALVLAALTMWHLAREDSFTVDERPHLAAGYGYLHHQTGRLNPEHPPLVKLLAAVPVRDIALPRELFERAMAPQELQYEAGRQILAGDYGRSRRVIRRSRIAPIVLTLLLAVCVYGLGRWLFNAWSALMAVLFLLASPLVLAHGHYVTTDVGAALGCVGATWAFLALLGRPHSRQALAWAVVAFGVAQLMKFSALLLIPFFALVSWRRRCWLAAPVVLLGFAAVVWPCYIWVNWNYPRELQERDIAEALADRPGVISEFTRALGRHDVGRAAAQYTLGVALAQHRVSESALFYFRGANVAQGSRWYFPLVYAWKEPLPAIVFALGALALIVEGRQRALLLFIALYGAASLFTQLNIGARHLLPLYPFVFLCAAEGWWRMGRRAVAVAVILLAWNTAETAQAFPHLLSYGNPIGGGTAHGYRNVTDSNYDWGQDLERLRQWSLTHPGVIALDYFGGDDAGSALGGRVMGWWPGRGDPRAAGARYFAISIQRLQELHPAAYPRGPEDRYGWLLDWRGCRPPDCGGRGEPPPPDDRAGMSIFIYDLERRAVR